MVLQKPYFSCSDVYVYSIYLKLPEAIKIGSKKKRASKREA
jgi:hypothetical protein